MQLRTYFILLTLFLSSLIALGQVDSTSQKIDLDDIDVTFLYSYYEQDGNHAAVTGGRGTEYLTNVAPSVIINFPVDTVNTLNFVGGIDYYSSASTDNIDNPTLDPNHVSGASASDIRGYATLGYKHKNNTSRTEKGGSIGVSKEFDVESVQFSASWAKTSKDKNKTINFKGSYFHDNWKLIAPFELRGVTTYETNIRRTATLSFTGTSVINKRMNASVATDIVYQNGLLSTPFHRVYFNGTAFPAAETLPSTRFKLPIALRLNVALSANVFLRTYYRYYWDNWGIQGQTVKLEIPIAVHRSLRLYPFYRFHYQNAADYFAPYDTHVSTSEFYTSDYDLSEFNSHKYGLGLKWTPINGVFRWNSILKKGYKSMFKGIDIRYAYFKRSDGLDANIWTFALLWRLAR